MTKTDKKIDNQIRLALTEVCETVLKEINGFEWLTHQVNYANFPQSLMVTCVFSTNEKLNAFQASGQNQRINSLIKSALKGINININKVDKHVQYDTEENCDVSHQGNWTRRLAC